MAKLDLGKYGIGYEGIGFVAGKETTTLLINAATFKQFIEIIKPFSLKMAYLLTIYMKITLSHKPFFISKMKDLAEELDTDRRTINKYSEALEKQGLIKFEKLDEDDAQENHQYIFTMGPKFKNWLWESNLFQKKKKDFVDNSEGSITDPQENLDKDGGSIVEPQGIHNEPQNENKVSTTDPQRNHNGPPENSNFESSVGNPDEKNSLPSFLPSILSSLSSSLGNLENFKNGKMGEEEKRREIELQKEWLKDIKGKDFEEYKSWLVKRKVG